MEKDLADAVRERAAAEEATKAAKYAAAKAEARAAKVADDVAGDGPSQPTAFDVLRPSVGDKRKPARETRVDPEDTTQRTVLRMFDPNREGIDETPSRLSVAASATRASAKTAPTPRTKLLSAAHWPRRVGPG